MAPKKGVIPPQFRAHQVKKAGAAKPGAKKTAKAMPASLKKKLGKF
jgi:hypothetical protein